MKTIYAIQRYEVGTKNHKGLAIYIPSEVMKKCNINTSSIFNLKIGQKTNQMLLYGPSNNVNILDIIDDLGNAQNNTILDGSKNLASSCRCLQEKDQEL